MFAGLPLLLSSSLLSFVHASPTLIPPSSTRGVALKFDVHHRNARHISNSTASIPGNIGLTAAQDDLMYLVNITLGGQDFMVQIDTGSSDLWVNAKGRGEIKTTNQTDLIAKGEYGSGSIEGPELFAELRLGEYTIPSQAFINATKFGGTMDIMEGILGMAFDTAMIAGNFTDAYGPAAAATLARGPMTNLWAQDPSLPPFFDILLTRTDLRTHAASEGLFLIAQHAPEYAARVAAAPRLPRVHPDHWSVALEGVKINGEPFTFTNNSAVEGVPEGTIVATLDTGATVATVPAALAEAIYSGIPGAIYSEDEDDVNWYVPCNSSVNVTLVFGGKEYPVHPLDVSRMLSTEITLPIANLSMGITLCQGGFQPVTGKLSAFKAFDLLLGDTFLKNVYASYNYGDDYDRANSSNSAPYVQLVSVIDADAAWAEFHAVRAEALMAYPPALPPSLIAAFDNATAAASSSPSPSASGDGAEDVGDAEVRGALSSGANADGDHGAGADGWAKYGALGLGLLGANLAVGLVLLGLVLAMCVRGVKGRGAPRYAPLRLKDAAAAAAGGAGDFEEAHLKYGD